MRSQAGGLSRRLVASFCGYVGTAILSFAFVPVYVKYLGIEQYGLVGFFLTLVPLFTLLDLGMGATLNRELARLSVDAANVDRMRNLTRTLEVVYWMTPLLVVGFMMAVSKPVASQWLQLQSIPQSEAVSALQLMGVAFAARLPTVLYFGALVGLDQIVLMNCLRLLLELMKAVGAVIVLAYVAPTLKAFFVWQIAASLVFSIVLALATWRSMPRGGPPIAQLKSLRGVARYALGVSGVAVSAAILMQIDKIVLSKVLTLEAFGFYSLAWAVAAGMRQLVMPLTSVFLPRMAKAHAVKEQDSMSALYHRAGRLMSVLIVPAGLVLSVFAHEVLLLWTRDTNIADKADTVLSLLAMGAILSSLANLPYLLQLVTAWTAPALRMNLVCAVAVVPLVYVLSQRWGTVGAAASWVLVNVVYLLVVVGWTHTKVIPGDLRHWLMQTMFGPILAASLTVVCFRVLLTSTVQSNLLFTLVYVLSAYGVAVLAAAFVSRINSRGST